MKMMIYEHNGNPIKINECLNIILRRTNHINIMKNCYIEYQIDIKDNILIKSANIENFNILKL